MDSLQDWPEPIVRVQAVAESGVTVVPERYVKAPADRPSPPPAAGPEQAVPVIDLAAAAAAGGPEAAHALVEAVSAACRDWGFFQVVNHGIGQEVIARAMEEWRRFFQLPAAAKQAYGNSPATYEGYGSRLGVVKDAKLDWGDYYFLHLLPSRSPDKFWPTQPTSCREGTEEYGRAVVGLCGVLMRVIGIGLGLETDSLQVGFGGDDVGACMRVNYYPKCPQPELTLGLSGHSDPGGLTVLAADHSVVGLQVRRGKRWVDVRPAAPDALIVNIGDQIQVLTNSKYKSVEHRVVVSDATDRLSLAFFYNPRSDFPLGPIRSLVSSERPALYRPMTFSEYRMFIRKKGLHGKAQVESKA